MLKQLTQKHKLLFLGILAGIVYALATRFLFGQRASLVSITYLFLVPAALGAIPLLFANDKQIKSYAIIIFIPWLTVGAALLIMVLMGWEDAICLLILAAPFIILVTLIALVFRFVAIHRSNKRKTLMAIVLLPFLLSPIEEAFESPSKICTVTNEVTINADPELVWNNIIRVPEIKNTEYKPGFFNRLGIPRPVEAKLADEKLGALRIGHFQGGLTFIEHITDWQPNKRVSFDIQLDPKTIRDRVFDQHVLKGNYFNFVNATYEIEPINDKQLKLRLISSYRLTSKVNFYNKFWGDLILRDFQDRLLTVIKHRCDN